MAKQYQTRNELVLKIEKLEAEAKTSKSVIISLCTILIIFLMIALFLMVKFYM